MLNTQKKTGGAKNNQTPQQQNTDPTQCHEMPTNHIGPGKANVTVTLTKKQKEQIEKLAKQSGMNRNQYMQQVCMDLIDEKTIFEAQSPKRKQGKL